MSTTIDQKVVEMRFDNKQFESNVQTSMSTIDKLKQKLNFTGATKGLEDVSSAAKKVDLSGLNNAVDTVQARFSSLQVIGVTALANLANSAVNAGKRIVSSLTIDPIKTGFDEYETQLNSVQTILANTQSKGSTLEDVNKALSELNEYADQTVYNFTEMTRNIGTFTAAGVDLDKSVTSIKGIANLAAVSGSTSQQASTAMYQLSQALAAGRVSLMDWNSVVNAGMGGEVFQTALKRTATQMGTNVDALIEKYGSFRESLTKGQWLTADVLTETLTQLSGAYTEADLIAQGYTEQQAKDIVELANTAVGAATDVKTFTGMMDTLKESVQSGWAQTWQILFGDFEEAKELWTGLSNFFGGIVQSISDARNNLLEGALNGSPFGKLAEKIESVTGVTETLTKATKDYGDVVDRVIKGEFGNGQTRFDALTKSGYDWAHVQNLVNERLGNAYRYATDYQESQDELNKTQAVTIEQLVAMSDAQLESLGFTKDEIEAFNELEEQSRRTGIPIKDLVEDIDQLNGRTLLINGFKNIGQSLVTVFKSIGEAWRDAFPPMQADTLYNIIAAFHKFTTYLVISDETADKLTRTLKGVFAILDIIGNLVGGGFKLVFSIVTKVIGEFMKALGFMDVDILDITATVGDAIVAFRDWLEEHNLIYKAIEVIVPVIVKMVTAIANFLKYLYELPGVQNAITAIKDGFVGIGEALEQYFTGGGQQIQKFLEQLKSLDGFTFENFKKALQMFKDTVIDYFFDFGSLFDKIPDDIIAGLTNGLEAGIEKVKSIVVSIGTTILDAIKGVLGIHSPSTETHEVGTNFIQGFVNGISDGLGIIVDAVKSIGSKVLDALKQIPWGSIIAVGVSVMMFKTLGSLVNIVESVAAPLQGVGDVLTGVGNVLNKSAKGIAKTFKGFANVLNGFAFSMKAKAIQNIAISLAILVGAIAILTFLDPAELWESVKVVAALAAILAGLVIVAEVATKLGGTTFDALKLNAMLLGLGTSMLLLAITVKLMGSMNAEEATKGFEGLAGMVLALAAVIVAYGVAVKGKSAQNINNFGKMLQKLAVSLLLMVLVVKLLGGMDQSALIQGGIALTGFVGIIALLTLISTLGGKNMDKLGSMLTKMAVAMLLLTVVVKLLGGMEITEIAKGEAAILGFVGIIALLTLITKLGGKNFDQLGRTLTSMAASMLLMTLVVKLLGGMELTEIAKGVSGLLAFTGVIALLVLITKLAPTGEMAKLSATLLAMSLSIGILAGVSILLGLISIPNLAKGIIAVGLLSGMIALMIAMTKNAQDVKGNLIVITVAIGIMTAAIVALSFIDPASLAGATAALTIVMGMFALIVKSASTMDAAMSSLIVLGVIVGLLATALYMLASLPVQNVLGSAVGLSVLLAALTASMKILSQVGTISPMALVSAGLMAVIMGVLGAILYLLADLPVESTIANAGALSVLLIALSAATLILAGVGATGPAAFIGIGALAALIVAIGGLMVAIGALTEYYPSLEGFLDKGIILLEKIGRGIGSFFGNIVAGFAEGAMSALPAIGDSLTQFMENSQGFIEGAKGIDESVFDGVAALVKAILALTAANVIDSIASWLTGGSSLTDFAEELVPFGTAMTEFSNELKGMDPNLVESASLAGKALAEMAATIPNAGGIVSWFTGENDMEEFADALVPFGEAMVAYSDSVKGIDAEAVINSATAGKALTELANTVPNTGGLVSYLTGDNNMDDFGTELVAFGKSMVEYSNAVKDLDAEAVTNSATAGKALTELASTVPNTGGLVSWFTGENDMETFGTQLVAFGKSLKDYSLAVMGLDADAITNSTTAGQALVALADTIPNTGGLVEFFTGDNDLETFGNQLVSFGESLSAYSDAIQGVDASIVTNTTNAVQSLVTLANDLPEDKLFTNETWLDEFGEQLSTFGSYFAEYYNSVSGINTSTLYAVINEANRLVQMAQGMTGLDTSGMTSFASALTTLGNNGIDAFINSFTDANSRVTDAAYAMITLFSDGVESKSFELITAFKQMLDDVLTVIDNQKSRYNMAGIKLTNNIVEGAKSKTTDITNAFRTILLSVVSDIKTMETDFQNVGKYVVDGFVRGIENSSWKAELAAKNLATATKTATQKTLDINSPSGVFEEIGNFSVDGLVSGVKEKLPDAENVGALLGETTLDGTEEYLNVNPPETIGADISQGIATGIKTDTSAEDAAAEKAKSISEAFQNEMSKIDLSQTILDSEYSLWEQTNGLTANEAQKSTANITLLLNKLKNQTEQAKLAQGEYQALLKEFGPDSEDTRNAYNSMLQSQIELAQMAQELSTAQSEMASTNRSAIEAYTKYILDNQEDLKALGMSMEDIQYLATRETGYDPNATTNDLSAQVKEAVVNAMQTVQSVYNETASKTFGTLVSQSTNVGTGMATAIGTGIESGTTTVAQKAISTASAGANSTKSTQPKWITAGGYLVQGFAAGITANTFMAEARAVAMANAAYTAAMIALQAHSPSRLFKKVGTYVPLGFAQGIESETRTVEGSAMSMAETAVNSTKNAISKVVDAINSDIDTQPTIRPVLDLSSVESGTARLSTLFSHSQAMSVNARMNPTTVAKDQNGMDSTESGTSFQFVQNNYSPKALSRVEIYRQTKNQFSAFGRVVKA